MATQILVVVLAAIALADGFAVRKPENVRREKRQATTQYPSYDTTYGASNNPWNYYTSTGAYPWQDSTTDTPYQTTDYNYWRYDTTYDYWNNYYTTYSPWRYETSYDYWNYYTTYNPWRYETPIYGWDYDYTTYNPWNRYDYWPTHAPNRGNQEVLLEALADDVVAEAREVVSGAEETLQKANDLEEAVFRENGEEEPRVYDYPILYR